MEASSARHDAKSRRGQPTVKRRHRIKIKKREEKQKKQKKTSVFRIGFHKLPGNRPIPIEPRRPRRKTRDERVPPARESLEILVLRKAIQFRLGLAGSKGGRAAGQRGIRFAAS